MASDAGKHEEKAAHKKEHGQKRQRAVLHGHRRSADAIPAGHRSWQEKHPCRNRQLSMRAGKGKKAERPFRADRGEPEDHDGGCQQKTPRPRSLPGTHMQNKAVIVSPEIISAARKDMPAEGTAVSGRHTKKKCGKDEQAKLRPVRLLHQDFESLRGNFPGRIHTGKSPQAESPHENTGKRLSHQRGKTAKKPHEDLSFFAKEKNRCAAEGGKGTNKNLHFPEESPRAGHKAIYTAAHHKVCPQSQRKQNLQKGRKRFRLTGTLIEKGTAAKDGKASVPHGHKRKNGTGKTQSEKNSGSRIAIKRHENSSGHRALILRKARALRSCEKQINFLEYTSAMGLEIRYENSRDASRGNMRKPRLGTLLLALWGLFLTAAVFTYLVWLQPSRLGTTVSRQLESSLNVQCDFGSISLSLFPLPSFHASDLTLRRGSLDHIEFHARHVTAQVSWLSLLRLEPIVYSLELDKPTLDISGRLADRLLDQDISSDWQHLEVPQIPYAIVGTKITLNNGVCRLASADGQHHLTLSGISLKSRLPGIVPGKADLSVESIHLDLASGVDIAALNTKARIHSLRHTLNGEWKSSLSFSTSLQMESLDKAMGRKISDPFRYFPMPAPALISFQGSFEADPMNAACSGKGKTDISAVLRMNGYNVPISASIPFQLHAPDAPIDIISADLRMGDDRVVIDGTLSGLEEGWPKLKGRAAIHHFSLTRWFGFGQAMNVGLQHALDNITGTFEDFELTPRGIVVPHLKANVEHIALEGSGSCKDFLHADIRIDAHARKADLNRLFPELRGHFPDMSHLPPPVLPLSSGNSASGSEEDSSDVTYDIHISADEAAIMNFATKELDVHVIPDPQSGTMLKILVGNLYGGKASSDVFIRDNIRVTAQLQEVSLKEPSTSLAGYPVLTGLLKKADADLRFEGGSGLHILSTLSGSLTADMASGSIKTQNNLSLPYSVFKVQAEASAKPEKKQTVPNSMNFLGKWNVQLQSNGWSVKASAPKATLAFSTTYGLPCKITRQPMDFHIVLDKKLHPGWPENIALKIHARSSFDAEQKTASFSDATVTHGTFTAQGSSSIKNIFSEPSASGHTKIELASLRKTLSAFGIALPETKEENRFQKAELTAEYDISANGMDLKKLYARVDETEVHGRLQHIWKGRPKISGNLDTPLLNLDTYLPPMKEAEQATGKASPLPLDFLKQYDMRLDLKADVLQCYSTPFSNVFLPITLQNGKLSLPLSARIAHTGILGGTFTALVEENAQTAKLHLHAQANNMDMLALSESRGQGTKLSGRGLAQVRLSSEQHFWDDWKQTLDGDILFQVQNGAIISPPAKTAPGGPQSPSSSRTEFNQLSMMANVLKGIVTCKDFLIRGNLLNVAGNGTVNLANQTIDAHATITLAGIPEMPLTLKGNMFSPETNYKLLGALTGTVGNIGATVIDIIGGVLSLPLKMIMGNRTLSQEK